MCSSRSIGCRHQDRCSVGLVTQLVNIPVSPGIDQQTFRYLTGKLRGMGDVPLSLASEKKVWDPVDFFIGPFVCAHPVIPFTCRSAEVLRLVLQPENRLAAKNGNIYFPV